MSKIKTISLLLSISLLSESVAGAVPLPEACVNWSDVINAGQQAQDDIETHAGRVRIPPSLAKVRASQTQGARELVLNIQDAHASLDAQKAISGILDHLVTNFDLKLIGLEGAEGRVDTSIISSYPKADVRSAAASYEMKQGRISAAEFYSMVSGASVGLYGVDDQNLYQKNLIAFRQVASKMEAGRKAVDRLRRLLKTKEDIYYSADLKIFLKHYRAYSDSGENFSEHWKHFSALALVKKISLSNYPNLSKLSDLIAIEKNIDFKKSSAERESLIGALTPKLSKQDLSELIDRMERLKKGEFAPGAFYLSLCQLADRCGIGPESHQSLIAYTRYALEYESLDVWAMFDEMTGLGESLREKLAITKEEKELLRVSDDIDRVSDLVELKLLRKHTLRKSSPVIDDLSLVSRVLEVKQADISTLQEILRNSNTFYQIAQERDQALTNNLLHKMRRDGVQVGALVTGGFHSEGIAELLDRQQISYMVVMPKYEKKEGDRPYAAILTSRPEVFEKALDARGYTLAAASLLDATPEPGNQMAIERMVAEMLASRASLGPVSAKQWRRETALFLKEYYRTRSSGGHISPKRLAASLRSWTKNPLSDEQGAYRVRFAADATGPARAYTVHAKGGKVRLVRVSQSNASVAAARLAEDSTVWSTFKTFIASMGLGISLMIATIFGISGEKDMAKGRAPQTEPENEVAPEPETKESAKTEVPKKEEVVDPIQALEKEIQLSREAMKTATEEYEAARKEGDDARGRSALLLERVFSYRIKIAESKIEVLKNQRVIARLQEKATEEESQLIEEGVRNSDIFVPRLLGASPDLGQAIQALATAKKTQGDYQETESHYSGVITRLVEDVNQGKISLQKAKEASVEALKSRELERSKARVSDLESRLEKASYGADLWRRIRIELLSAQKAVLRVEAEIKAQVLDQELKENVSKLSSSQQKAVTQALSRVQVVDEDEAKSLEYLFEAESGVPMETQRLVWRLLTARLDLEEALEVTTYYERARKEADRVLWGEQTWEAARVRARILTEQTEARKARRKVDVDKARREIHLGRQAVLIEKEIKNTESQLAQAQADLEKVVKKQDDQVEERQPGTPIPIPTKLKQKMIEEVNEALKAWTKSGRKITDHPAYKLTIPRPYDDFYRYQLMFSTEKVDENLRLRVLNLFDQGVRTMTQNLIPRQMLLREYNDEFLQNLKGHKLVGPHTFFTDESKRWGYDRFQSLFDETNQDRARLDILMYVLYVTDEDQSETYLKPLVDALPVSRETRKEFESVIKKRVLEPNPFKKPYWDRVAERMTHEASKHPIHTPPQPMQTSEDAQIEALIKPTEYLMRSSIWAAELNPHTAPTQNNMAPKMGKNTFNPVEMPYFSPSGLIQSVMDHGRRFSDSDLEGFDESMLEKVDASYVTELQKLSPTKAKVIPVENGKKRSIDELISETERRFSLMREENKLGRHRAQLWLAVLKSLKNPENYIHQGIRQEIEKGADLKQAIRNVYQKLAYSNQRVAELMQQRNEKLQAFYDGINSPGKEVIENSEFYRRYHPRTSKLRRFLGGVCY